jgi:hypothetical protein
MSRPTADSRGSLSESSLTHPLTIIIVPSLDPRWRGHYAQPRGSPRLPEEGEGVGSAAADLIRPLQRPVGDGRADELGHGIGELLVGTAREKEPPRPG